MRKLIHATGVSLDGFIAGPKGEIDWSAPDEELHRFHNPSAPDYVVEFARIWQALPKIVFSNTLETVEGNARLARDGLAEEVAALKQQPGKDLAVGGAGLAASCIDLGLVDEFRLFVSPVVLGGGTQYFPPLAERIDLELVETRTFGSRASTPATGARPEGLRTSPERDRVVVGARRRSAALRWRSARRSRSWSSTSRRSRARRGPRPASARSRRDRVGGGRRADPW
jgi:dihydrofolate reductase